MGKRIAIAFALLALLAAGYFAVVRKQGTEARKGQGDARLLSFDDRAITGFTLTAGGIAWHVVREPRGWRVVAPRNDTANDAFADELVAAARRTPILQTIAAPDALASYGLDPPAATLALEGTPLPAIELGHTTPAGDGVFLRVAGRPGVLIAALPQAAAFENPDPDHLRTMAWIDLAQSEVRGVTIERRGGAVRASRRAEGWWLEAPEALPAAAAQVERLLGGLYGAKVVQVDDAGRPADPKFGLERGSTRFTLTDGTATRVLVLGGDAGEGRRFARSDARQTILTIEGKSLDALPEEVATLRETRLTNVNRYAVKRFEYTVGTGRFAAARSADKSYAIDGGGTLPAEDVYALLVRLLEAPTRGVRKGTPAGPPAGTFTYTLDDGATGSISFHPGSLATWSVVPGIVYELAGPPPPLPGQK